MDFVLVVFSGELGGDEIAAGKGGQAPGSVEQVEIGDVEASVGVGAGDGGGEGEIFLCAQLADGGDAF